MSNNGNPELPTSLHCLDGKNYYKELVRQLSVVLQPYNKEKTFYCYGYGAAIKAQGDGKTVTDGFNLKTLNNQDTPCTDMNNLLEVYQNSLNKLNFMDMSHAKKSSGVSNYLKHDCYPLINLIRSNIESSIKSQSNKLKYNLLILFVTDDSEMDTLEGTLETLVACEALPLSIFVIGMGQYENSNFSSIFRPFSSENKEKSVAKIHVTRSKTNYMKFIPSMNIVEFTANFLTFLPAQIVSYYRKNSIVPLEDNDSSNSSSNSSSGSNSSSSS